MKNLARNQLLLSLAIALVAVASGFWLLSDPRGTLPFLLTLASLLGAFLLPISKWLKVLIGGAILLIVVPAAGFQNSFLFELGVQIGIYAAMALGLNVVVGLAGLLDLGYAAFFAVGAYTWAIFGSKQANEFMPVKIFPLPGEYFYLFMLLAVVAAAITGLIIGLPALRLKGDYLAIVTLGLGEVVRVLANNLDQPINITNGPQGITPIQRPPVDWFIAIFNQFGIQLDKAQAYPLFFYFLVLGIIGIVTLVNIRLDHSRFGRAWIAIREDEIAARAMGIPLLPTKLLAFATGASFSGAMGALFAAKQLYVSPESFTLIQSIIILVMVILGGMGSIPGAILGAATVTILNVDVLKTASEYLEGLRSSGFTINLGFFKYNFANLPTQLEPAKYERMVFGLIMVLMMIYRPEGIIPEKRRVLEMRESE